MRKEGREGERSIWRWHLSFHPFFLGSGWGRNLVPSACASLYLFSASLNWCYSRKFHLDSHGKKDNKTLWFLWGALNKWIHLEASARPVCILTLADETQRWRQGFWERRNGKGCSAVIGFDVCQEGNSFSLGLLGYLHISLLWPSDPVKISLFMWYGVAPPHPCWPTNWGPLCAIYSLGFRRHLWSAWYHISAGCVRLAWPGLGRWNAGVTDLAIWFTL